MTWLFNIIKITFFLCFFHYYSITVVPISPPLLSPTLPISTSHIQSSPPLALCMGPSYMFLEDPSPSFPCYSPSPSPLVTVSLFCISMSLALFCLLVCFVDQAPLIDETICYLSFTTYKSYSQYTYYMFQYNYTIIHYIITTYTIHYIIVFYINHTL